MAQVALEIHGRRYEVACDDDQVDRVQRLGAYIDQRARELVGSAGSVGESRLLLMTALLVADELFELAESGGARQAAGNGAGGGGPDAADDEEALAEVIDGVAERLERIAARLERS